MKRFLIKLAVFSIAQIAVIAWALGNLGSDQRFYESINTRHALAESAAPPRLLIVGGSSTPIAFDGERIRASTGLHPVILGVNAASGLDFQLAESLDVMREGDVVLLAPEYVIFTRSKKLETYHRVVLARLLLARPSAWRYVSWSDRRDLLDHALVIMHELVREGVRHGLRRKQASGSTPMDAYGGWQVDDDAGRYDPPPPPEIPPLENTDEHLAAMIDRVRRFDEQVRQRGGRVAYFYCPYEQSHFEQHRPFIEALDRRLKQTGVPLLCEPGETVQPADQFLDTAYHLHPSGRQVHTDLLIERLKAFLARTK